MPPADRAPAPAGAGVARDACAPVAQAGSARAPRAGTADAAAARDALRDGLAALVARLWPDATGVERVRRLSAGATLETWSFDATGAGAPRGLILRRAPGGLRANETLPLATEAALVRALAGGGVPVAPVVHTLVPGDGLGDGFVMVHVEGETIARKLLRDDAFAAVRPRVVARCGEILAALHRTDPGALPALAARPADAMLASLERRHRAMVGQGRGSPVFALALRWLRDRMPAPLPPSPVHGDFRLGNLMIDPSDVVAVLDWEIAHLGDPAEDLAWICLPPWRFGNIARPVAGLGTRAELFAAYERAGGAPVDAARVHWWEVLGSLRWGLGTAGMAEWFASGRDPAPERAMIARRVSENEIDLLRALDGSERHDR